LAVSEAAISLEALQMALKPYFPHVRKRNAALARRWETALRRAVDYLRRHPDFEAMDRLTFIRDYGNPLYAAWVDVHSVLGIATSADFALLQPRVHPRARHLFAKDFLNPHAFADIPDEKPNPKAERLGQLLFFDPVLSRDNRRACASCHQPEKAFSDGLPKSAAFGDSGSVGRNAPSLVHAAFQNAQFWDARAKFLENQIEHVVANPREFHSGFGHVLDKLGKSPEYRKLFSEAFPGDGKSLTVGALTKSLALYLRSLGRWDSPFDRYMRKESAHLDPAAKRGFNLFMGKGGCGTCHFPPAFNGTVPPRYVESESEVLGVPATADTLHPVLDADPGRFLIDYSPVFRHAFKTPTVRNAALTGPYMHNGVFATLEEVLRFYNVGGGKGMGLEVEFQTLPGDSVGLSRGEIQDVIAFMHSLTDTSGIGGRPRSLPEFPGRMTWNSRAVGGEY
jgi:cytochrome c peroxidase